MVVYLKQDFSYLLYAFYSRYGEEMYMTVAMLEEVFHLSGCPLYAECLCIIVGLALQHLLCQFFRYVAVEGLGHHGKLREFGEGLDGWNDRHRNSHLRALSTKS